MCRKTTGWEVKVEKRELICETTSNEDTLCNFCKGDERRRVAREVYLALIFRVLDEELLKRKDPSLVAHTLS